MFIRIETYNDGKIEVHEEFLELSPLASHMGHYILVNCVLGTLRMLGLLK